MTTGNKLPVMAAALVAVASCAVQELPPPDGWQGDLTPVEAVTPGVLNAPQTLTPVSEAGVVPGATVTDLVVDQQKLLDIHNSVRQRLGIPPLRWSTRLESYAAGWANFLTTEAGCTPRRRGAIGLSSSERPPGENLQLLPPVRFGDGRTEVAAIDENKVVLDWARQGIAYNYADNKCGIGKVCENYTQLVWRDSQVLGCAAASCPDKSQIWVCNYDPAGNFAGQKPY